MAADDKGTKESPNAATRAVGLLGLMYVIVAANFTGDLFSCDLKRTLTSSLVAKHAVLLLGAVFWVAEANSSDPFWLLLCEAFIIYVLFVLSTKSKAVYMVPVIVLMVVDQLLRLYAKSKPDMPAEQARAVNVVRKVVQAGCVTLIVVGFASYLLRQVRDKGSEFDFGTFMLGTVNCQ